MSDLNCRFADSHSTHKAQIFNQCRSKGYDFSTFTSVIRKTTAMTTPEASGRSWPDLPSDILILVESFLLGRDRCCFHGVCRSWRSVVSLTQSPITLSAMNQSPLLMFIGRVGSLCNFYHPLLTTKYIMDVPELADAKIRYSKDGWLLISQGKRALFFFNPFTKERIDLPKLEYDYDYKGISFSSVPTSSDCIVYAVCDGCDIFADFDFIRHGENGWNRCVADNDLDFITSNSNPVFHNGIFYWLGRNGNFATFDPKEGSTNHGWTVLPTPNQPCVATPKNYYLAECNGKLISVFEGRFGNWIKIFELDDSLMTWRKVESLGDKKMFLSPTTSLLATSAKQALGMENKIFFPRFHRGNCVFYSLFTGRFHNFATGYNSYNNDNIYNTKEMLHCTWIQPSFEKHSDEELKWNM